MTSNKTIAKTALLLANKRILHVINSDGGGGVEHLSATLAKHQAVQGAITKTLFLYSGSALSKRGKILGIFRTAREIVRFRPDIVVTFQPTSSVISGLVARLAGCHIHIAHQSNLPQLTHKVPRLLDRLAGSWGIYSVIIMNSTTTKNAFKNYPAAYRRKLRDITHGVDWFYNMNENTPHQKRTEIQAEIQAEIRAKIRKKLGISPTRPVLFSCARLSKEKSLETIIKALSYMPDTLFLLAGDGPHKQVLQDLVQTLGASQQVKFLGHITQDQLPDLYRASDLFVFPSTTETFGMAAVEAAMGGMVIVASDIPTVREVLSVQGQSAAILVKDWKPRHWADTLTKALKNTSATEQAEKMAPKIRDFYSTEKMLEKYSRLYREIL